MDNMLLYVWDGVLADYTGGLAVAMAHTVEEAREVLLQKAPDFTRPLLAQDIARPPDEVHDEPAGTYIWGGG